jgi:cell division protein FtsB
MIVATAGNKLDRRASTVGIRGLPSLLTNEDRCDQRMQDILLSVLAGLASLIAATLQTYLVPQIRRWIRRRILRLPEEAESAETYGERLHRLTGALRHASREVDNVLAEVSKVTRERESAVTTLESQLATLTAREQELQERIAALQNVPLPVAEHFAALAARGEQSSARRDYVLFGLGVLVSTLVSVLFFLLQ